MTIYERSQYVLSVIQPITVFLPFTPNRTEIKRIKDYRVYGKFNLLPQRDRFVFMSLRNISFSPAKFNPIVNYVYSLSKEGEERSLLLFQS